MASIVSAFALAPGQLADPRVRIRALIAIALPVALAACGAGEARSPASLPPAPRTSPRPPPTRPAPPPLVIPEAQVMRIPGLEGVIGANAAALRSQFGQPRLDLREGDVRKLQFSGEACVLDIYLYPPNGGGSARGSSGGEPTATHVEARRSSDGQDVDRAACVAALRRR